jgi:hypothetical protein
MFRLFLDKQEWIEANPAQLCLQPRTFLSIISQSANKYDIDLSGKHSSVLINLRFNASQVKKMKSDCKFTINTKRFHKRGGIYLNILKMKLRQHRLTEKCIDSLQIKYNQNIKQSVCGTLNAGKIKSYEDLTGKVKITLNVDHSTPFDGKDDFIEFQLVATAFKGNKNT